jgi:hypothetical protein
MRARNKYYKLDEVGFVGVQKYRTPAEIRKEAAETAKHIKALKARKSGTVRSVSPKAKRAAVK